ncbi:MAG: mechanosensitive ion channel domain-containing protein [Candidatus Woesearchaeota archaeon]
MFKKLINLLIIIVVTVIFWFARRDYAFDYLGKLFYTFLSLGIVYFLFKVLAEEVVIRTLKDQKARYSFKKIIFILTWMLFIFITAAIWIKDPQSLLIAYGIIGAGIAIALQDVIKNFVGGIVLLITKIYRVGDRIEINGEHGDVIDISVLYTSVLEIKEWIKGDQATGRIKMIPNSQVLSNTIDNYTKDHSFIWDEIVIPITYNSDWKKAKTLILKIVEKETAAMTKQAAGEISRLSEKYYLGTRPTEPNIFIKLTDNWIEFNIRYITDSRQRRKINDLLSNLILEKIQTSKNIQLASQTVDIIGFPGRKK